MRVQIDVVLLNILEKFVCAKHFGNLDELVVIVMSVEERLLTEDL